MKRHRKLAFLLFITLNALFTALLILLGAAAA